MQRHKELYKEQSLVLSPRNHCQENRDRLHAARAKKRDDCFYQNRIISVSPTPVKTKQLAAAQAALPQENVAPKLESPEQLDTKPAEQQKESNPKVSRQKLYLQRYMEWKTAKTKEHKQQDQNRRGAAINVPTVKQSKVLPKSQTFRVPDNLASAKQKESSHGFQPPKRCSLYVIANPTGNAKAAEPIKPSILKPTSATPSAAKVTAAPPSSNTVPASSALAKHKSAASVTKIVPPSRQNTNPVALARQKAAARPISNTTKQTTSVRQPAVEAKKITTTISRPTPATVTKAKTPGIRQQPPVVSTKPRLPAPPAPRTARLANVLSQPFEKPLGNRAPVTRRANVVKPQPIRGGGGAAAKFKDTAGATSKAASHSMRMKATKIKSQYTRLQDNVRKLPQLKAELLQAATLDIPPHTPLEDIHNPFIDQATSTQCKSNNSSGHLMEAFGDSILLSPVAPVKVEGESSVKRQLLPVAKKEASGPVAKKKFDFTRYSVANSPAEDSLILDPQQTTVTGDSGDSTLVPEGTKTPPRRESNGMPNYLSPFVSVSRGKVNSRCEKEKRNSFYLSNEESPLEVRRAIESVLYFRLQLENEIRRLEALCAEWEAYSKENEARLQETGGIDMINVTIGQTRLLTTKKMMQFSGLIDRCEAGATGKNRQPNDGSEDSKPVQPEDLEGWWDMLRLQSENVDKRFDNLKRWKANDWLDPDAVAEEPKQPKPKHKISRNMKIKSKAKPSSNLQQFLRKAHANMKKTKVEEPILEDGLPSTSTRHSSPRVIVVRNRRSFSPARTVLRMSTGEGRQSIAPNALLKSAILAAAEQNAAKTPPPKPRASILKTPGTTKRQNRGVLFSAKKSVRRFQFTYEEGNISNDETVGADKLEDCEEDMSLEASTERRSLEQNPGRDSNQENEATPRMYTLRNRRVNLRPSSEFM
ncbi:guanylate kinase-associated protein mars isoform X1 [Drosophila sechellia]|uniref:GM21472 n=1 Tax=Drosophila sechellia TaxID=7238 RepID=B4HQJ6_DROSE|nr:guanylate kinase-associated protein mars isoform X1 [Drosophila sechellia]EDW47731.1 GM21472 [Drosophila sechellia]